MNDKKVQCRWCGWKGLIFQLLKIDWNPGYPQCPSCTSDKIKYLN